VPLLCDVHEIGEYTRDVSRQRLGKHIPTAMNWHATTGVLLKMGYFYVVCAKELCWRQLGQSSQLIVLHGSLWREDMSMWSWRISTVRSHCQKTAGEDTVGWKRLHRCCGDLWIVEISDITVITCTYKSCV
jgi:hypothetical protein